MEKGRRRLIPMRRSYPTLSGFMQHPNYCLRDSSNYSRAALRVAICWLRLQDLKLV